MADRALAQTAPSAAAADPVLICNEDSSDPLVRQLAEEIIAGQRVEIAAMQARLQAMLDKLQNIVCARPSSAMVRLSSQKEY